MTARQKKVLFIDGPLKGQVRVCSLWQLTYVAIIPQRLPTTVQEMSQTVVFDEVTVTYMLHRVVLFGQAHRIWVGSIEQQVRIESLIDIALTDTAKSVMCAKETL